MLQLERKFRKNPEFKERYVQSTRDYLYLASKTQENYYLRKNEHGSYYDCYYMPHLAMIKESSTTTKTRVVFDASRSTSNGRSLNDCLLVGLVIQPDIVNKINSARMRIVLFVSDMDKMYRQIKINE